MLNLIFVQYTKQTPFTWVQTRNNKFMYKLVSQMKYADYYYIQSTDQEMIHTWNAIDVPANDELLLPVLQAF